MKTLILIFGLSLMSGFLANAKMASKEEKASLCSAYPSSYHDEKMACLNKIEGKRYNSAALNLCTVYPSSYHDEKMACLNKIEGKRYDSAALKLCAVYPRHNHDEKMACLKEIEGKRYDSAALNLCTVYPVIYHDRKISCLQKTRFSPINGSSEQITYDIDDIDFTSTNTQNIVKMYTALAAVSVKERADFLPVPVLPTTLGGGESSSSGSKFGFRPNPAKPNKLLSNL